MLKALKIIITLPTNIYLVTEDLMRVFFTFLLFAKYFSVFIDKTLISKNFICNLKYFLYENNCIYNYN